MNEGRQPTCITLLFFRSNPTQRGSRKRMMEIWQELSNFQTTSQRLGDQVKEEGLVFRTRNNRNTPKNK